MSCPNKNSTDYANYINRKLSNLRNNGLRNTLPSFTPILTDLSVISSVQGSYQVVYVNGANFLPNGTTFIKFGSYGYLPVIYYSSFNLSFVVPLDAPVGNYNVYVVNIYNGNFSPPVKYTYPANLNYSTNNISYEIT